jgi:hypothetical protein
MKRERLHLSAHTVIETGRDWNGRFYIAYSNNASVFLRCPKEVRKFLKLPAKIPMRESFDSWIASLEAADASKRSGVESVVDAASSFDPLAHGLDESDPNHQAKTVI